MSHATQCDICGAIISPHPRLVNRVLSQEPQHFCSGTGGTPKVLAERREWLAKQAFCQRVEELARCDLCDACALEVGGIMGRLGALT